MAIHNGIQQLGIGEGSSRDFLPEPVTIAEGQGTKRGRKIPGKADARENQFLNPVVYTLQRFLFLALVVFEPCNAACPSQRTREQQQITTPPPARLSIRHIEPQGVGYRQGYTTLDFFVALASPPNFTIPFVDVRGHVFDHGQPAVNAGFGLRFLTSSWVFGVNSYYDYRKTERAQYNQIGVGFEMLGNLVDLRMNGYFPLGGTKSPPFHTKFSHFQDHYAILKSRYEFAMIGLNAEAGFHMTDYKNAKCYAALGPYYFTGRGKQAIGGSARLSGTFYEYFQIEASGSYDPVFKWIGQGQIGLVFSFGSTKPKATPHCPAGTFLWQSKKALPKPSCPKEPLLWQRTVQPVDRNEIIVLDRTTKETVAIDPQTQDPYIFWFVNNTSSSQGTIESPFPTLAQAANVSNPRDIIYVFPGGGASYDVGNNGFTLKNNQKLWGTATEQTLDTTLGRISIPRVSGTQPRLVGGSAAVGLVNLTDNSEVAGIHFSAAEGTAGYAISGGDLTASICNVQIKNNTIDGVYGLGNISIIGRGKVSIQNNAISFTSVVTTLIAPSIAIGAIHADFLHVEISSNTITTIAMDPLVRFGISATSFDSSQLNIQIDSNTLTTRGVGHAGVLLQPDPSSTSQLISAVRANTINVRGANSYGIHNLAAAGSHHCSVTANQIAMEQGSSTAIYVKSDQTGELSAIIGANTIHGIGDDNYGIQAEALQNSALSAAINANRVTSQSTNHVGINMVSANTSHLCAKLTDNMTSPPSIELSQQGGSTFNLAPSLGNTPATFTEIGTITPVSSCD